MSGVDRVWRRMQNLVAWGSTTASVDDSGPTPTVQTQLTAIELQNGLQILSQFGFSSSPPAGSRVLALFGAGNRAKGTILGTVNALFRRKGLQSGESSHHDQWGNELHLAQPQATLQHTTLIVLTGPKVTIVAPQGATIQAAAGLRVEGPINCTGEVKAFCDGTFVTLSQHHGHTSSASPPTPNT